MTKDKAIYNFWQQFGIPFYPTTNLPPAEDNDDYPKEERLTFPYGTFEVVIGNSLEKVYPTVKLYFRTDSEVIPNKKVDEISQFIGQSGYGIKCDTGLILIRREEPWSQGMLDPQDDSIKVKLLSVSLEFLTTD